MTRKDEGKFEEISEKAQSGLQKFFDDPAKVEKAQEKAEKLLAKRMGESQAEEVVDKLTDVLRGFAHGGDKES